METKHPDYFHGLAHTSKKHEPTELTIKLAKEFVLPYQNKTNKTKVIVGEEEYEECGIKRRKNKIVQRTIRFDEKQKEFYIYYDSLKYWVRPIREPLNEEDINLYYWTIFNRGGSL